MTHWKLFACTLASVCYGSVLPSWGSEFPSTSVYVNSVQQADRTVKGTVTDGHGEPLPGVSVTVKGTTQGTITNLDGQYTLKVGQGAELAFSFVDMQSQNVHVKESNVINVILRDDNVALDDVVAIGYGSKNRKSLTSSISSVKKEDIERMAPVSTNMQDLIGGGMLKGVLATQNSGEPGSSISINVRGITSPYPNTQTGTNNNAPLYVIDGVPLFVEATSLNPLMNLSPNDIESIDVLKDASATAIYGSRGANGVIIVTTKKGRKEEKPTVEVGYSLAIANPVKESKPLNREEFLHYTDQNLRNATTAFNEGIGFSNHILNLLSGEASMAKGYMDENGRMVYEVLNMDKFGTANTNWVKEVKNRNALTHQYHGSVRGGSQKTNYSISLNGTNQEGLYKHDRMESYGGRIAIYDDYNRIDTSISSNGFEGTELYPNPVALLERSNDNSSNQFLGNLFAEIELFKGLKFRTDFSMTNYTFKSELFSPKTALPDISAFGMPLVSQLVSDDSRYATTSLNFRLDYSLNLQKHLFGAMLGYGSERPKSEARSFTFEDFPALSLGWIISEENFVKDKNTANNLKLRLSLGQTGSTNVADFVYKQYYVYGTPYGDQNSIILNGTLPNRNIGWEKTSEVNTGLDFSLFDNRLYGSFDWYYRYTDGALAPAPHILESGMVTYYSNIIEKLPTWHKTLWTRLQQPAHCWNRSISISTNKDSAHQKCSSLPT